MNRREFIQTSSALSLLGFASFEALAKSKTAVGCQLYSVRDKMAKDPIGTMRSLAEMGYTHFESYSKDPFWGMDATQAKKFFKEIGVQMVSSHTGVADVTDEMAAKAKEIGLTYLICPAIGPQKSADEWKKRAEDFNKAGEICKKYGLKYGYHNHSYSFENKDGVVGQDILLANTDPKLVVFELDMFWSEVVGINSIEHIQQHKGRYELIHVKQLISKDPKPSQGTLTSGLIDYKTKIAQAKKAGIKHVLVEQEQYAGDSMNAMRENAQFIKSL